MKGRAVNDQNKVLRAQAEGLLGQTASYPAVKSAEQLLHELQVHQIELEMQNETLRQTQIALELSAERYRDLYDFAPIAYLTLNAYGMIIEINHAGADLLGKLRQRLINSRFSQYVMADDQYRWDIFFLRLLKNHSECDGVLQIKRPDGGTAYVQFDCRYVEGENTTVRMALTDITAHTQTERMLRESEEKFRAIYEYALDGILLFNPKVMKFVQGNPRLCAMVGYTQDEFTDLGVADIHRQEDLPWILADIEKHLRGEIELTANIPVLRRDGSIFYADIKSSVVKVAGEEYMLAIFHDVTHRRQAEITLRESAEKYRAIFEGTLDGIVLVDVTGRMVDCNPEFERQCGMSADTLKQLPIWALRAADKAELAKNIFFDIMSAGTAGAAEFKYKKPDGRVMSVYVRAAIIHINEQAYLQCIVRDITDSKLRELELREYQQLLRQLAAQGVASREAELKHIAREVHDELGQLLTALRMDISLMRIQFGMDYPVLMPKIQDMLGLVDKAIAGVRDVTANLHPPAMDMGLMPAIEWLCHEVSKRTDMTCCVRGDAGQGVADEKRTLTLFRIVQESLTNVVRYAHASRIEVNVAHSSDHLTIEIRDDGIGFVPDSIPAVQSFGLMGMKERALAAGGRVEITSVQGEGTLVFVEIPNV